MPKQILLVEDSPTHAMATKLLLERCGYQVYVARNGRDALTRLSVECPDAMISDVMMPEMDGFELCQAVKENANTRHVPVLLVTASANSRFAARAMEVNADGFLNKPFEGGQLREKLEGVFRRAAAQAAAARIKPQEPAVPVGAVVPQQLSEVVSALTVPLMALQGDVTILMRDHGRSLNDEGWACLQHLARDVEEMTRVLEEFRSKR